MEAWAAAFSAETPEAILALYAEDAVLWGTLSPVRRVGAEAIRDYFERVFPFAARKVTFQDPLIRMHGDTALNTGAYTFSWEKGGETVTIAARYSFACVKRNGRWLIADHHSSVMPAGGAD